MDPYPDPLAEVRIRGYGSAPKCHRSPILLHRSLISISAGRAISITKSKFINKEPYVEHAISENPFNFSLIFLKRVLDVNIFKRQKVAASEHEAGCTYRICPIYNCQMPENFLPYFHRQAPIHKHTVYTHVIVFTKSHLCIGFARIMQDCSPSR